MVQSLSSRKDRMIGMRNILSISVISKFAYWSPIVVLNTAKYKIHGHVYMDMPV